MSDSRGWKREVLCIAGLLGVAMSVATGCPSNPAPPAKNGKNAGESSAPGSMAGGEKTSGAAGYGSSAQESDPPRTPIFVDWPDPVLTLVISGEQHGYLEPCGCAGLGNQKGGLGRRHALLELLADKGWNPVPLDLGGQVRRSGRQAEIKFDVTRRALEQLGYRAVAFGLEDLQRLTTDALIGQSISSPEMFVSANVALPDVPEVAPFRVIETDGRKIGVTGIMGAAYQAHVSNPEIRISEAAAALETVHEEFANQQFDLRVLLSHATMEESRQLSERFPEFDIVVTAGSADEPRLRPEFLEGPKTWLVDVGHKGMYVYVIGVFDDQENPLRFERIPLDSRFDATTAMENLMAEYQAELEALGLEGLGLTPVLHPRAEDAADPAGHFAGAESCKECHTKAYQVWMLGKARGHAHVKATETLLKLGREHDPECLSCHTTGWNPQEYFPYVTGFTSVEETPLLVGNGCENCHGPGQAHIDAERGNDMQLKQEFRSSMILDRAKAANNLCVTCHDHDNSPDFDFETYWPKVEHQGKD